TRSRHRDETAPQPVTWESRLGLARPADAALDLRVSAELHNLNSGLCMGILPGDNPAYGRAGDAVQWTCNGNGDQRWFVGLSACQPEDLVYCKIKRAPSSWSIRAWSPARARNRISPAGSARSAATPLWTDASYPAVPGRDPRTVTRQLSASSMA